MEKALFVSRSQDITSLMDLEEYDYLYFGNEFCEHLIPCIDELKKVLEICEIYKMKLVLVTPYISELGLNHLKEVIIWLKDNCDYLEIVVNDWGVYYYCKSIGVNHLVIGRLLNKMERDMRISSLCEPESTLYTYVRTPSILSNYSEKFLLDNKIERIEFDNVFQGIDLEYLNSNHKYSLYYPFLYLTTSRICPNNYYYKDEDKKCTNNCYNESFDYRVEDSTIQFFVKGRTVFLKNDTIDEKYYDVFDRLIMQIKLPH